MDLVNRLRGALPMTRGAEWAVVFLTVLIVTLTSAGYALSLTAIHRAARNAATITQLCQAINGNRHRQVILWQYLVAAAPLPPHESAEARRQRLLAEQALMVTVDRIFAPSSCQHP
jgi:hypothetical protein